MRAAVMESDDGSLSSRQIIRITDAVLSVLADPIRAVDEDVRAALMWGEEVILSLPERWNDDLIPEECGEAFQRAYASLRALRVITEQEEGK